MYNLIEGIEVKCFNTPTCSYSSIDGQGEIWFSVTDRNIEYKKGDKVPYKTWWYNYTANFNIYDTVGHNLILIRQEKIQSIKPKSEIFDDDFALASFTVDEMGYGLNVTSAIDIAKLDIAVDTWRYCKENYNKWDHNEYYKLRALKDKVGEDSEEYKAVAAKSEEVRVQMDKKLREEHDELLDKFELEDDFLEIYTFGAYLKSYVDNTADAEVRQYLVKELRKRIERLPNIKSAFISFNTEDKDIIKKIYDNLDKEE